MEVARDKTAALLTVSIRSLSTREACLMRIYHQLSVPCLSSGLLLDQTLVVKVALTQVNATPPSRAAEHRRYSIRLFNCLQGSECPRWCVVNAAANWRGVDESPYPGGDISDHQVYNVRSTS